MKCHLARVAGELAARDSALRPVAAESLHVTLVFLGATPPDRAGAVWEVAHASVAGIAAPQLSPGAIAGVPRRRPRLLPSSSTTPGPGRGGCATGSPARSRAGSSTSPSRARSGPM